MPTSKHLGLVLTTLLVSACWNARKVEIVSSGEVVATRVEAQTGSTLPAGADMSVRLDQTIPLDGTKAGDPFSVTVSSPLIALNGDVVVPRGARIYGKVLGLNAPTDSTKHTRMNVEIEAIEFNGKRFPLKAFVIDVSDSRDKNAFLAGTKMMLRVSESVLLR